MASGQHILSDATEPMTYTAQVGRCGASEDAGSKPRQRTVARPLRSTLRDYRLRLLITYALFCLENVLRLLEPAALGWAINSWLDSSWVGLGVFVAVSAGHTSIGLVRQMYDTRSFTSIYTDLASKLVTSQRGEQVDVSHVAARCSLSRDVVSFFEHDVPLIVATLFSTAGALVVILTKDYGLALCCLSIVFPAVTFHAIHGRRTYRLNALLHDTLEKEVQVISSDRPEEVRGHFATLASYRTQLSDWSAAGFGLAEALDLGLICAALIRSCALNASPGEIVARISYVAMFTSALHRAPHAVQQIGRLHDICRRLRTAHRCERPHEV